MIKNSILLIFSLLLLIIPAEAQDKKQPIALVIHGGAGVIRKQDMTEEAEKEYRAKLDEALAAGYAVLEKGGRSMDAVVAAIRIMEESPLFNAGRGAVFTNDGRNELDASVMEGKTKNAGAVSGVTTVKSPITAAVAVMEKSEHVMLSGPGAEKFAAENGLEMVDNKYFYTEHRYQSLLKAKEADQDTTGSIILPKSYKYGTVGAVALDREGNIAAGTSTGGMTNKRYGRVGDAPIIGAGTYAENETAGISCTGHGEYFIRIGVAKEVTSLMRYKKMPLQKAADEVIHNYLEKMGGSGGLIGLDRKGNTIFSFNSEGMFRASLDGKGKKVIQIYKEN